MKFFGLGLALALPTLVWAQDRIDPNSMTLSPIMEIVIPRGATAAGELLWVHFEKFAGPDPDVIVLADMESVLQRNVAKSRAGKVYGYIAADLNWDGQVTRSELEAYFVDQDQRFVDGYLLDGDLNQDDVISLDEMLTDAKEEHKDRDAPTNGFIREMITWDLNRDGRLEWSEVMDVIIAKQDN